MKSVLRSLRPQGLDFCSTNVSDKIVLREAFSKSDMTKEILQVALSPNEPYFRLFAFGGAGSSHCDCPRDSHLMKSLNCNQTQVDRHKISSLRRSAQAWVLSSRCLFRQVTKAPPITAVVRDEDGQVCFVENYCCLAEFLSLSSVWQCTATFVSTRMTGRALILIILSWVSERGSLPEGMYRQPTGTRKGCQHH